jgi:hypothetical protein
MVCGPFQLHWQCPLGSNPENCLIYLAIANDAESQFISSFNLKQKWKRLQVVEAKILSLKWSHRPSQLCWQLNLNGWYTLNTYTNLIVVYILKYKPCHVPLDYRCPIKSDIIGTWVSSKEFWCIHVCGRSGSVDLVSVPTRHITQWIYWNSLTEVICFCIHDHTTWLGYRVHTLSLCNFFNFSFSTGIHTETSKPGLSHTCGTVSRWTF